MSKGSVSDAELCNTDSSEEELTADFCDEELAAEFCEEELSTDVSSEEELISVASEEELSVPTCGGSCSGAWNELESSSQAKSARAT